MDVNNNYGNQPSEPRWFYAFNGQTVGPIPQSELLRLLNSGTITPQTLVVKEGTPNWVPVSSMFVAANNVPIAPTGAISNTLVWIVAFIPIIGTIIEFIFTGAFELATAAYWGLISMGLCLADMRKLKKSGYNTKNQTVWAILVIPVYLFRRAKLLMQKNTYAIIWCVVFAVDLTINLFIGPALFTPTVQSNENAPLLVESDGGTHLQSSLTIDEFIEEWNSYISAEFPQEPVSSNWGIDELLFIDTVESPLMVTATEPVLRDGYVLIYPSGTPTNLGIDYAANTYQVAGLYFQYVINDINRMNNSDYAEITASRPAKMLSILTDLSTEEALHLFDAATQDLQTSNTGFGYAYSNGIYVTYNTMDGHKLHIEMFFGEESIETVPSESTVADTRTISLQIEQLLNSTPAHSGWSPSISEMIIEVFHEFEWYNESYEGSETEYIAWFEGAYCPNPDLPELAFEGKIDYIVNIETGNVSLYSDPDNINQTFLVHIVT